MIRDLLQDTRYAARMLRKSPGSISVAALSLALGIGAISTIFSFVNGIMLRPLPYPEPERLVILDETALKRGVSSMSVSFANFLDWREQNQSFEDIGCYTTGGFAIGAGTGSPAAEGSAAAGGPGSGSSEPEQLQGAFVSQGTFEVLGVPPFLGRTFTAEEDQPDHDLVVILSHALWQRRFGGDPNILGQTLLLNNRPRVVIGVMPKGFQFPEVAVTIIDERLAREYWPDQDPIGKRLRFGPPEDNEPWDTIVGVVGEVKQERLDASTRKSVYLPHAQVPIGGSRVVIRTEGQPESLVGAVRSQVRQLDPDLPITRIMTMKEIIARSVWQRRLYTALFGVFAAVALFLATVGIYGVMSYAVTQRTREIGLRMALGAQRSDVLKLVVGHAVVITAIGLGVGLAAAAGLTQLMSSLLFGVTPTDTITFASVSALLAGVAMVACFVPARRAAQVDPMVALRYE